MPRRSPTTHHIRQRARLVDITREIIIRDGYAAVRLGDLARTAGMSAPAIYTYFESRDELLTTTIVSAVEAVVDDLDANDDSEASSIDRMSARLRRWSDPASPARKDILLLHQALVDRDKDPVVTDAIARAGEAIHTWFRTVLEDGIARGEVRPTIDPSAVADLVNVTALGIELADDNLRLHRVPDRLYEVFLEAVVAYVKGPN
jgi:AcrR family transcriptional regulator